MNNRVDDARVCRGELGDKEDGYQAADICSEVYRKRKVSVRVRRYIGRRRGSEKP